MFDPRIGQWDQVPVKRAPRLMPKPEKSLPGLTEVDFARERAFYEGAADAPGVIVLDLDLDTLDKTVSDALLKKNAEFVKNWLEMNDYLSKRVENQPTLGKKIEDSFYSELMCQPFEVRNHASMDAAEQPSALPLPSKRPVLTYYGLWSGGKW